jgi:hypothetical protein
MVSLTTAKYSSERMRAVARPRRRSPTGARRPASARPRECPADPARCRPLEADSGHARTPAGGDEQAVAAQLAAVGDPEDVVLAVAARGARRGAEDELDPVAAQALAERLAQRRRLARRHAPGPLDEHHFGSAAAGDLRHLPGSAG